MIRACAICIVTCVALLLGACATAPALKSEIAAAANSDFQEATAFELVGRLSIRQNDRLDSVKIMWTKSKLEERLQFFTPFGSQVAEIIKTTRGDGTTDVILNDGKQTIGASSIEQLTESTLGVPLEVEQIARWVQGLGLTENMPQDVRLKDGSVWQVTAERFQLTTNLAQPTTQRTTQQKYRYAAKISALKNGGDISLRLVVDEWRGK